LLVGGLLLDTDFLHSMAEKELDNTALLIYLLEPE
jgi:hypothetical protein